MSEDWTMSVGVGYMTRNRERVEEIALNWLGPAVEP